MIHAFDTYYYEKIAKTVCLTFKDWSDTEEVKLTSEILPILSEYKRGEFYKRELPSLLSIISKMTLTDEDILVIDGYVTLNTKKRRGLGWHLYDELKSSFPVIGVAKNEFSEKDEKRIKVYRGISKKPLFVTSIGINESLASEYIKSMSGNHRIPDLLKKVDKLTRLKS